MHELAVTQNVIRIIESEAAKQGFKKVVSIKLAVGELSGVVPECLREFFPIASKDTIAFGARLDTVMIPAAIECAACGYRGAPVRGECPRCASSEIRLTAGREFFVDSIEVE